MYLDNQRRHVSRVEIRGRRLVAVALAQLRVAAECIRHSTETPLSAADVERARLTGRIGELAALSRGIAI